MPKKKEVIEEVTEEKVEETVEEVVEEAPVEDVVEVAIEEAIEEPVEEVVESPKPKKAKKAEPVRFKVSGHRLEGLKRPDGQIMTPDGCTYNSYEEL